MALLSAKIDPKNAKHTLRHHVRTVLSSLFGFIAVGSIVTSIVVVWLGRTVTNTDTYVKTVGPLVNQPAVQDFVVDQVSNALLSSHDEHDNTPQQMADDKNQQIREIASQLLGKTVVAGKTDEQLRTEVTPLVEAEIRTIVTSASFANLWIGNNRAIHEQLLTQLRGNSSTITLNFRPLITGIFDQLHATKLNFVKDKLELPQDAGLVTVQNAQLSPVRKAYDYVTLAMVSVVVLATLATALCVAISIHHWKTLRRVVLLTGLYAALLAIVLGASSLVKSTGNDLQQAMIFAVINSLTSQLRLALSILAVLCIGGVIAYKFVVLLKKRKKPATTSS